MIDKEKLMLMFFMNKKDMEMSIRSDLHINITANDLIEIIDEYNKEED